MAQSSPGPSATRDHVKKLHNCFIFIVYSIVALIDKPVRTYSVSFNIYTLFYLWHILSKDDTRRKRLVLLDML